MDEISEKLKELDYKIFLEKEQGMVVLPMEIELAIGFQLPSDYVRFLRSFPYTGVFNDTVTCRGIEAAPCAPDHIYPITFLFAACSRPTNDLLGLRNLQDEIPIYLLVIGVDDGGNYFCLDLRSESYGKIYFIFHETEGAEGLYLLENDFASFINSLEVNP